MTFETSSTLNELIRLVHDGEAFYSEVAQKAEVPAYRDLFERMARIKLAIACELAMHSSVCGDTSGERSGAVGKLLQAYAELRASIGKDPDNVCVVRMEEIENRVLDAFKNHLKNTDNGEVRGVLMRYLPEAQETHGEMRVTIRRAA